MLGVSLVVVAGSPYGSYWTTDFGGYVDPTAHAVGSISTTTTTQAPTTTTKAPTTTTAKPSVTTTTTPSTTTTTTTQPRADHHDDAPYHGAADRSAQLFRRGTLDTIR